MTETNWEHYFGTPERAGLSMADANGLNDAFRQWADGDGSLICSITCVGGKSRKIIQIRQAATFGFWLEQECKA